MFGENDRIKRINDTFGDEISKRIFAMRYMWNLTGDKTYIEHVIRTCGTGKKLWNKLSEGGKPVIIFGTNKRAEKILPFLPDINWVAYSNMKEKVKPFHGLPKIALEEINRKYPDGLVLITIIMDGKSIKEKLVSTGMKEDNIILLDDYWMEMQRAQYFDLPELNITQDECFVDCGAYDMETTEQIIKNCKKIYAFEPDSDNYNLCKEKYSHYIKEGIAEIYPYATYSRKELLRFADGRKASSELSVEEGNVIVQAMPLDEVIHEKVSFIKMDVEGAELESLKGAVRLLKTYRPKLAICVYHKPEDIIEIPEYILSIDSSYRLYLRHYKLDQHETVLYAI